MKSLSLFVFSGLVLLLAGCGTTGKFVYPARMQDLVRLDTKPIYEQKVAVLPMDDYRGDKNTSGTLFLSLIPLVPYGWVEYERPDAAKMFLTIAEYQFSPSEDLAKAAALSLRNSQLFRDAYFSFGGEDDRAVLILKSEIHSTKYYGRFWSYGLSVVGIDLQLLGVPLGDSQNTLILTFALYRKDKRIWDYKFDRTSSVWQGHYYNCGDDGKAYAELMQQAMNEAILDLQKKLRENPKLLD